MSNRQYQRDALIGGTILVGAVLSLLGIILFLVSIWSSDIRWAYTAAIPTLLGLALVVLAWRVS